MEIQKTTKRRFLKFSKILNLVISWKTRFSSFHCFILQNTRFEHIFCFSRKFFWETGEVNIPLVISRCLYMYLMLILLEQLSSNLSRDCYIFLSIFLLSLLQSVSKFIMEIIVSLRRFVTVCMHVTCLCKWDQSS